MAKGSKSLGTFYGYADGSRYGKYSPCVLSWSDVTRDGTKVKIKSLTLTMTHATTGWSAYRFACKGSITGSTSKTYANNYTLKEYQASGSGNPDKIEENFGDIEVTSLGTTVSCYIEIASTGGSTSWSNFKSTNLKVTFDIACPPANPTYKTNPSITEINETTATLNRGTADIESIFQCREYKEENEPEDNWITMDTSSLILSDLIPNTTYTYEFKAINKANTSFESAIQTLDFTTYQYPYITAISQEEFAAGGEQVITLHNPKNREVMIYMEKVALEGETEKTYIHEASTSQSTYSFTLSNEEACEFVGFDQREGDAIYYCRYNELEPLETITGSYKINIEQSKPSWADMSVEKLILYKDGNATTVAVTEDDSTLIQGHSQLYYGINYNTYSAVSNYYSSIVEYQVSINGANFIVLNASSETAETNANLIIPSDANSISIRVKAKDARGLETPIVTRTIPVTKYVLPSGSVSVARQGGYGNTIILKVTPIWGISTKNAGTGTYTYQKDGGSETTENISVFGQDILLTDKSNDSVFTFTVELEDKLGGKKTLPTATVGIGQPILFIDSEQTGVGVNCFPNGKGLYVKGNTNLNGATNIEGEMNVNGSATINGFLVSATHRNQTFERDGESRSGWFYNGGE